MDYEEFLFEQNKKFPTFEDLKEYVETTLKNRKQKLADYNRLPDEYPTAGVLICLCIPKEVIEKRLNPLPYIHLIYEKRSDKMNNHPGQMAFPGGTIEDQDNGSIIKAATREAMEEIGINQDAPQIISLLDEFIASSNILVHPVVSWLIEDIPKEEFGSILSKKYKPHTKESVATVTMPLFHLLNPAYYSSRPYEMNGKHMGYVRYFYTNEVRPDDEIWGLTATMTRRLLDSLFPNNLLPEEA